MQYGSAARGAAARLVLCVLLTAVTLFAVMPCVRRAGERLAAVAARDDGRFADTNDTESADDPSVPVTTDAAQTSAAEESSIGADDPQTEETADPLADVYALQNRFRAEYADKTPAGTVREVFWETDGATDILGSVAIKNATATKKPDFAALLDAGVPIETTDPSQPTVLIFHTHTTESYLQTDDGVFYSDYVTRSESADRNMVRVGDEICRILQKNGIGVVHDTEIHDKAYDGAYARSRTTVLDYLQKYPTVQIALDVHRDAIYYSDTEHAKPTAVIDGKKAAQVMIITGAEEGQITDFPNWEENLKFALALQKTAQDTFPGIMRPVYFCQRKYNMDTAKYSLLLEFGTDANTLEEACRSAAMIGEALSRLLKG